MPGQSASSSAAAPIHPTGLLDLALDGYREDFSSEVTAALGASRVLVSDIESLSIDERTRLAAAVEAVEPLNDAPTACDLDPALWRPLRETTPYASAESWPVELRCRDAEPLVRALLVYWRNAAAQIDRLEREGRDTRMLEIAFLDVGVAARSPTSTGPSRSAGRMADRIMSLSGIRGALAEEQEESFWDRITDDGELVAYQDWDSGGPGAGAGRVSVYCFENKYYAFHDAGSEGPFETKREAAEFVGVT